MKVWGAVVLALALTAPSSFASVDIDPPDTTAPVISIATGMRYAKEGALITATATDNVGVTEMHLYIDGVLIASSWVGTISYAGWSGRPGGKHKIRIVAMDAAQNVGSAVATFRLTASN
jgi:hypothetical protein